MYSAQTSKVNVKRSAIRCIPVRSPMAYVNLSSALHNTMYRLKVIQVNTMESVKPARDVEKH